MPHYRIYEVGQDNRIVGPPRVITCDNDQEALQRTKSFLDGQDIELWDGARLIAKLPWR
jgi:hypothetical protein